MQKESLNMKDYGYLLERYSADIGGSYSLMGIVSYSMYDSTGKVIKRRKKHEDDTLYSTEIMRETIWYLKDNKCLEGDISRYIEDSSIDDPDIIVVNRGNRGGFPNVAKAKITYEDSKDGFSYPCSSYSAIYPKNIAPYYSNMGFKFGDLWNIFTIDYKYDEKEKEARPSKITLYTYAVNEDKRDKLIEVISDIKDPRI